jgi:hypothetical protein
MSAFQKAVVRVVVLDDGDRPHRSDEQARLPDDSQGLGDAAGGEFEAGAIEDFLIFGQHGRRDAHQYSLVCGEVQDGCGQTLVAQVG